MGQEREEWVFGCLWDKDPSLVGLRPGKQDIRGTAGHIKDNLTFHRVTSGQP